MPRIRLSSTLLVADLPRLLPRQLRDVGIDDERALTEPSMDASSAARSMARYRFISAKDISWSQRVFSEPISEALVVKVVVMPVETAIAAQKVPHGTPFCSAPTV